MLFAIICYSDAIFKKMSTQVKQTLESVYQMPNKYRAGTVTLTYHKIHFPSSELIHIEYLNSVMKQSDDTMSKVRLVTGLHDRILVGCVQHGNFFRKTYEKCDKGASQRMP